MRAVLIAVVAVLAVPAFAHEHEHKKGQPVVLDKTELEAHFDAINAQLTQALSKAKRDKKLTAILREVRDELEDISGDVDDAQSPRDWWQAKRSDAQYSQYMPQRGDWDRPGGADRRDGDGDRDRDHDRDRQPGDGYGQQQYGQNGYPNQVPAQQPGYGQGGYANQTPPPQQQTAQQMVYPIEARALQNLLAAIDHESFPNDRLRIVTQASQTNYFICDQVKTILSKFTFPRDRLNAMRTLKPRLLDRENAYSLQASFEFPNDKAELQRILAQ